MVYNPRFNNRPRRQFDPNKVPKHTHTPFEVVHFENDKELYKYKCDKDGKVTIIHEDKIANLIDEVTAPASLIFKLVDMLNTTRRTKYEDRVKKDESTGRTTQD